MNDIFRKILISVAMNGRKGEGRHNERVIIQALEELEEFITIHYVTLEFHERHLKENKEYYQEKLSKSDIDCNTCQNKCKWERIAVYSCIDYNPKKPSKR